MITNESMTVILRDYINISHDGNIAAAAAELGTDASNLSKMLKGDRPVSAAVAAGLGFIKMDHVFRVKS